MGPSATINDYLSFLRLRAQDHVSELKTAINEINATAHRHGAARGGHHVLQLAEELRRRFKLAAADLLRVGPQVAERTGLAVEEMLAADATVLNSLLLEMTAITGVENRVKQLGIGVETTVRPLLNECRELIPALMRQAAVGLDRMWEGDHVVSNTIHANQIIGPVQQGTSGSTQTSSIAVDIRATGEALRQAEEALAGAGNDLEAVAQFQPDLDTVRAQLQKREPSRTILSEVGHSIRALAEGVTAGLLTPPALAALIALSHQL